MKKGSLSDGVVYHAGFPNAGEDQRASGPLSLDQLVIRHRASTFFWRLEEAIETLGWVSGTIVVVDRALTPHTTDLVVIVADDDFRVVRVRGKQVVTLEGEECHEPLVWGVVTYALVGYR